MNAMVSGMKMACDYSIRMNPRLSVRSSMDSLPAALESERDVIQNIKGAGGELENQERKTTTGGVCWNEKSKTPGILQRPCTFLPPCE